MNQANKQVMKVALITGGARRIGASIVQYLHEASFNVIIHCHHSLREGQELAKMLNQKRPNSAHVLQANLCAINAPNELLDEALAWGGRLDLLVNNASVFNPSPLTEFNESNWEQLFATNVKAPYLLSLAARAELSKQQGGIINLIDIHGEKPLKNYAEYCQSKAALVMQTKALAKEFAPEVRVNAVSPGAIIWPEHINTLNEEEKAEIIAKTPLKRHGHPRFIAQAILALSENPFITGEILKVDGGRGIS